jgi:hypothetical protein
MWWLQIAEQLSHCLSSSQQYVKCQSTWIHGRYLQLAEMHEDTHKGSLTMVSQFPEDIGRRPTDIAIAICKRFNQLGNARLHGLMEESCNSLRDALKYTRIY